jgi:hypothetical protein
MTSTIHKIQDKSIIIRKRVESLLPGSKLNRDRHIIIKAFDQINIFYEQLFDETEDYSFREASIRFYNAASIDLFASQEKAKEIILKELSKISELQLNKVCL